MPRNAPHIPTGSKPVTVKDVAQLAGTSPSTVSRVLTGRTPVAEAKRDAVLKAIAALSFRPNLVARSLKTRSTHSIGLLINDILNPFYGALARGVEDRANELGYAVIFCNTNENPEKERAYLSMLEDKGIDGIVLAPTGGNLAAMQALIERGVALVQIDRRLPGLPASSVTVDNAAGGAAAARHLIERGHSRIGQVTYAMGQMTVVERERGCREALEAAGLAAREAHICRVKFDLSDTHRLLASAMQAEAPPTALILANNRITLPVLRALRDMGIRSPQDIALVVFDDLEIFDLLTPSLTAIDQPAYAMGRKAADFLLEQIPLARPPAVHTAVFQPTLIVRESSL